MSVLVGLASVAAAYVTAKLGNNNKGHKEKEIENALSQQASATKLPTDQERPVQAALLSTETLMKNYHEQALAQARVQFWFGLIAATLGFLLILVSSVFGGNWTFIQKVVPGSIIASVATLFLRQSAETRKRATDFYDRLQSYSKQRESLNLVTTMSDARLRSITQTLLALHMAGASTTEVINLLTYDKAETANRSHGDDAPTNGTEKAAMAARSNS